MTKRVRLLVGTKKGAFILDSDEERADWSIKGPLCEGWPVHDMIVEPDTGAILVAAGNAWYGPAMWRTEDGGFPVDATGVLPSGKAFNNPAEMRKVLSRMLPDVSRTMTEKLLTYALGRGLDRYDRPHVGEITKRLDA